MNEMDLTKYAGEALRRLIKENYSSQEEFAFVFGASSRNVNRWINQGLSDLKTIQELAMHFDVPAKYFISD